MRFNVFLICSYVLQFYLCHIISEIKTSVIKFKTTDLKRKSMVYEYFYVHELQRDVWLLSWNYTYFLIKIK
jgi:hypothetical protein